MNELIIFLFKQILIALLFSNCNADLSSDVGINNLKVLRLKRASQFSTYEQLVEQCPDIRHLCPDIASEELSAFDCLIKDSYKVAGLSANCQYAVWKFADFYYSIKNIENKLKQYQCEPITNETCLKDNIKYLNCISKVTKANSRCQLYLNDLQSTWSSIANIRSAFVVDCNNDIDQFKCSDLSIDKYKGNILDCLKTNSNSLSKNCYTRVNSLVKDQFRNSNGRALARACKDDIKLYHCRKGVSDDKDIRWAQILLCLEGAIRNRSIVDPHCQEEVVNHRTMLFKDYHLSPEIVDGCSKDITQFCNGLGTGGVIIHCLMEHARPKRKKRVSVKCLRALEDFVKQTDAGEDWRVDPILHQACNSVVDVACKDIASGNARVMSCLIDKIGSNFMTEDCENALMQIQYFVARDFKLDPQLYQNCRNDAVRYCHAKPNWDDFGEKQSPENAPMVLPCLYRYVDHPNKTLELSSLCTQEIKRVMRQRAISVDLQPEVEDNCLQDLAMYCYDKTARGEETSCLQSNLENLQKECRKAVTELTERQGRNVMFNPIIKRVCGRAMQYFCSNELNMNKDEGGVMDCLISYKNHPDLKVDTHCRAAIEHFQLIELKDYHFTFKFKEACKSSVVNYCPGVVTKADVIECLSERVLNDTLQGTWNTIRKECRQQLRAQLFQQRENIDFDPKLENVCAKDIKTYCSKVERGYGRILECLRNKIDNLSRMCHKALFRIKKKEMVDNGIDYTLITTCKLMIKVYCSDSEQTNVLECLKMYRSEKNFDDNCKHIVVERMIEQNKDYRLNPALQKACQHDITSFCSDVIVQGMDEKELNGKMVKCLKNKFREAKLKPKCEKQMIAILREQALNYKLNPLLRTVCAKEIEGLCKPVSDSDDSTGEVEECLKNALFRKQLINGECKTEVAAMIEESKADIHVDPLLQRACSLDLMNYCKDVPKGNGRHLKCLKMVMSNSDTPLTDECKEKLVDRIQMFESADKVLLPEGLRDLYGEVSLSPARRYFAMVALTVIGFIFMTGLFCGRITKRAIAMKNK